MREVDNYDHNKFDRRLNNSLASEQEKIDQRWMALHGDMLRANKHHLIRALPYLNKDDREIIEKFLTLESKREEDGKNKM